MRPAVTSALVLSAGLGTRLRPLTWCRAKPAVPVAGSPLIRQLLRWLAAQGVRDLVLNLHYKPETITREVGDGCDLGVRVRYSWEPRLLGTAGGPRRALPILGAPRFFIVNGDTLCDIPLAQLVAAHTQSGARVTVAVVPNPAPRRYGGVAADEAGRVRGFTHPGDPRPGWHFVGVQLVEANAFASLADGEPADSIPGLYSALARTDPGAIRVQACEAVFHDIGTPRDYLRTSLALARAAGLAGPPPGARSRIDPTARLIRTAVWDDVSIEAGCELIDCVVGDGVRLAPGARFERCVIMAAGCGVPGEGQRVGDVLVEPLDGRGE